jgi:4'-phosphopantetheinyl transferase
MPLLEKYNSIQSTQIGIWKIQENEAYFLERLDLSPKQAEELATFNGNRRLQWLAARHLGQLLAGKQIYIEKDVFGKPFITHHPHIHISLSHSGSLVAAMIGEQKLGIDIQQLSPKLIPISWRIIRAEELHLVDKKTELEHVHVYWGAREALFKAHGIGNLDFRKDLHVEPFSYRKNKAQLTATIKNEEQYVIEYRLIAEEYMLVSCLLNIPPTL